MTHLLVSGDSLRDNCRVRRVTHMSNCYIYFGPLTAGTIPRGYGYTLRPLSFVVLGAKGIENRIVWLFVEAL